MKTLIESLVERGWELLPERSAVMKTVISPCGRMILKCWHSAQYQFSIRSCSDLHDLHLHPQLLLEIEIMELPFGAGTLGEFLLGE